MLSFAQNFTNSAHAGHGDGQNGARGCDKFSSRPSFHYHTIRERPLTGHLSMGHQSMVRQEGGGARVGNRPAGRAPPASSCVCAAACSAGTAETPPSSLPQCSTGCRRCLCGHRTGQLATIPMCTVQAHCMSSGPPMRKLKRSNGGSTMAIRSTKPSVW